MNAWKKLTGAILTAVLGSVLAISQMSCLSPAEAASLAGFNTSLQNVVQLAEKDKATVVELQAELAKYRTEFMACVEDIKAKKVPAENGIALLGKIMANINSTQTKIAEVQALIEEHKVAAASVSASITELKEKDVPWQYWLLPIGTAVAGIAGMFIPGISPLAQMLGAANQQVAATREAAGSMSRTLDTVTAAADAKLKSDELATLKGVLMAKEQSTDELAVKTLYDEIRAQARANLL